MLTEINAPVRVMAFLCWVKVKVASAPESKVRVMKAGAQDPVVVTTLEEFLPSAQKASVKEGWRCGWAQLLPAPLRCTY